jgi:TolA-binding protein
MAEQAPTQPAQSDAFYDFLAWLDRNKKQVALGVGAVLVAIAGYGLYSWNKQSTELSANDALFALPSGMAQSRGTPAPKPDAYIKVAEEYRNTSAGERAEMLAAGSLFSNGDYAKSQAAFEKFMSDRPESPLKPQAAFGVAACLEAQGKADAAKAKYQEVAQQYRAKNVAPLAKLSQARMLETEGKLDEALKIYQEMEASTAQNDMWKGEAVDRKEKLFAHHPDFAKTHAPPKEQIIEVTTPPDPNAPAPAPAPTSAPPAGATNP